MADGTLLSQIANPAQAQFDQPMSLQDMATKVQSNKVKLQGETLSLQQMQQDITDMNKAKALWGQPGMQDPQSGMPTAQYINAVGSIRPELAQKASKARQDWYKEDAETRWKNAETQATLNKVPLENSKRLYDVGTSQARAYKAAYDAKISAGGSKTDAEQAGNMAWLDTHKQSKDSGLLAGISDEQEKAVLSAPRDIDQIRGRLAAAGEGPKEKTPSEYEDIIAQQKKLDSKSPEYQKLEQRRKHLTEYPPTVNIMQTADGKPVAVQTQADHKPTVTEIPGGPLAKPGTEKPASGGESGRASVFTNRMVTSANEAMKDLKNVVQLPITSSRGIFGGRTQEGGLMSAAKESLTNSMTTQEVQLFNVMTAGIQRNLASIEAVGLMPSGTLTHQMDSVVIKEGDTQLTKASRLAQIRQILEGGLEPVLANPKVSEDQKVLVRKILKQAEEAVPYTQTDVIKLMSASGDATLGEIIKSRETDKEGVEKSGVVTKPYTGNSGKTPGDIQDLLDKYK